jgi:hypothetical protein
MASPVTSSGARDLEFISSNPATEAYREGERAAQQRMAGDLAIEHTITSNAEQVAGAPSRLRALNANADTAQANAQVATGTVEPRIQQQQSAATISDVNARYAEPRAQAGLRQANAAALNAEMQSFYKSLELLNAGRTDEAMAVAQATGQTIPQEVIDNAQVRNALTLAAKHAQEAYPNRPKDQQSYIHGFITDMAKRAGSGQAPNDPTAIYNVPGAPAPQEDTSRSSYEIVHRQETDETGQPVVRSYRFDKFSGMLEPLQGTGAFSKATGAGSGTGSGRTSVFQQKQTAWLAVHPGDNEGALAYASGRRQMSEAEMAKSALSMANAEIKNNQMLRYKNQAEQAAAIQKRAAEIAQMLRTGFAPQPTAPTAPATPAGSGAQLLPAPRDPAQRVLNQVYLAPDGRNVKWLGNGQWQVVP